MGTFDERFDGVKVRGEVEVIWRKSGDWRPTETGVVSRVGACNVGGSGMAGILWRASRDGGTTKAGVV